MIQVLYLKPHVVSSKASVRMENFTVPRIVVNKCFVFFIINYNVFMC